MSKLSVIIPTLQNNTKVLNNLLLQLNNDISVDEIILIDNSKKGITLKLDKLKIITPESNLYVNPSWNLGVKQAKNDFIGLINDDIELPEDYCSKVTKFISEDIGILGMNSKFIVKFDTAEKQQDEELYITPVNKREYSFGILMFLHKKNYHEIPDDIKVWYGDDYIFLKNQINRKQNYILSGIYVKHMREMTSGKEEFNKRKQDDWEIYKKLVLTEKYNLFEYLFSVKNAKDRQHKIITFLGMKLKIKVNKIAN